MREPRQSGDDVACSLVLSIDVSNMTTTLVQGCDLPLGTSATSQGSLSILSNGNAFVGWGAEFSLSGKLRYEVYFASKISAAQGYRAAKQSWTGRPATNPDVGQERERVRQLVRRDRSEKLGAYQW